MATPPIDDCLHVFAYGTLRGDCSDRDGDHWGVLRNRDCHYIRARVTGFRLYL